MKEFAEAKRNHEQWQRDMQELKLQRKKGKPPRGRATTISLQSSIPQRRGTAPSHMKLLDIVKAGSHGTSVASSIMPSSSTGSNTALRSESISTSEDSASVTTPHSVEGAAFVLVGEVCDAWLVGGLVGSGAIS